MLPTGRRVWTIQGHRKGATASPSRPTAAGSPPAATTRNGQSLGCGDRRGARQLFGTRPLACATWLSHRTARRSHRSAALIAGQTPPRSSSGIRYTGHETASLKGHTSLVTAVAYFPGGRRLATASDDRTIKLWDIVTDEDVFTLRGHTSGVVSLAVSRDGRQIVSGSIDYSAKTWSTATPDRARSRRAFAPPRGGRAGSVAVCQALAQGRRARGSSGRKELEPAVAGGRARNRRAPHRECLGTLRGRLARHPAAGGPARRLPPGRAAARGRLPGRRRRPRTARAIPPGPRPGLVPRRPARAGDRNDRQHQASRSPTAGPRIDRRSTSPSPRWPATNLATVPCAGQLSTNSANSSRPNMGQRPGGPVLFREAENVVAAASSATITRPGKG